MVNKKTSSVNLIVGIVGLMLLTKVLGLGRDAWFGRSYGAGLVSDAYLQGVDLTINLFLGVGSALSTNLIPKVVKQNRMEGEDNLVNQILSWLLMMIFILSLVYYAIAPTVVSLATDFQGEKALMTILATRMMIPAILFIGLTYFMQGMLQANEKFLMPALMSVPYNLLFFVFLWMSIDHSNVYGLAIVTVVGWGAQLLLLLIPIIKHKLIKFRWDFSFSNVEVQQFFIALLPIIIVTLTYSMNILIDNKLASAMNDGDLSTIHYGTVLFRAVVQTTVYGITAVMFPKFNHKYMDEAYQGLSQSIINVLRSIFLLLIPMSVGMIVLGENIITLFYEGQEFTAENTAMTIIVFTGYTSFMIAFGTIDVLNKAYYTIKNVKKPLIITATIVVTNVLMSEILVESMGYAGIVTGTAIAYYVGAVVSLFLFFRKESMESLKRAGTTFIKSIIAASGMGAMVYLLKEVLLNSVNGGVQYILALALSIMIGVLVYGLLLILFREDLVFHNVTKYIQKLGKK